VIPCAPAVAGQAAAMAMQQFRNRRPIVASSDGLSPLPDA
jgi:hypothetical protein